MRWSQTETAHKEGLGEPAKAQTKILDAIGAADEEEQELLRMERELLEKEEEATNQ